MFIELLSFNESLATKCMSLNNEQSKTRLFSYWIKSCWA